MKILIVEDDRSLSRVIQQCLAHLYDSDQAFDGAEGFYYARQNTYDLIILDLMLPEMDGLSMLERLRQEGVSTPVIILTAKNEVSDRTLGFRTGADDYLAKPFDTEELLLRIEAILRRSLGLDRIETFAFLDLVADSSRKQAAIAGFTLPLKGKQYDMLEYLIIRQGRPVSKSQIFDKVWGFLSDTSSNVVEVYASAIRKALKPQGYDRYLKTIRGAGYMLTEEDIDE